MNGRTMQDLNFTAIDFETANSNRGSVCAVGITKVRNGAIADSMSWVVRPPAGIDHFDSINIGIHGIDASQTASALDWMMSLEQIMKFAAGDPLVAHNAAFDHSVFKAACRETRVDLPHVDFFCSLKLARRELQLAAYTLPDVAEALGMGGFNHHHAGSDADVCAQAVIEIARHKQLPTVSHLWPARTSAGDPNQARRGEAYRTYEKQPKLAELPQPHPDADPAGALFGQTIVVTGPLASMTREEAMVEVAAQGASNGKGITKKTTMLVIGTDNELQPEVQLTDGSSKERKAAAYIQAGQAIQILSENQLLGMLSLSRPTASTSEPKTGTPAKTTGNIHGPGSAAVASAPAMSEPAPADSGVLGVISKWVRSLGSTR
jgi:DNA polymerase-3 subunit epsilon